MRSSGITAQPGLKLDSRNCSFAIDLQIIPIPQGLRMFYRGRQTSSMPLLLIHLSRTMKTEGEREESVT